MSFSHLNFDEVAWTQSDFKGREITQIVDQDMPVDFLRLGRHAPLDQEFGFFAWSFDHDLYGVTDKLFVAGLSSISFLARLRLVPG